MMSCSSEEFFEEINILQTVHRSTAVLYFICISWGFPPNWSHDLEGWLEVTRGEILGLVQEGEKQNHLPRRFSSIKIKTLRFTDNRIPMQFEP